MRFCPAGRPPLKIHPVNLVVRIPPVTQKAASCCNTEARRFTGLREVLVAVIVLVHAKFRVSMPFVGVVVHHAKPHVVVGIVGVDVGQVPLSVVKIEGEADAAVGRHGAVVRFFRVDVSMPRPRAAA